MVRLDAVNVHLLRLLQRDARMTHAEMARRLGRSQTTVRSRIDAMERGGLLHGYQARVDWGQAGLPGVAVLRATCAPNALPEAAKLLASMPNVTAAVRPEA